MNMNEIVFENDFTSKIEKAYKDYKISQMFLKDVTGDYGKVKLAELRMEFARHELSVLLRQAKENGVRLDIFPVVENFYNNHLDSEHLEK